MNKRIPTTKRQIVAYWNETSRLVPDFEGRTRLVINECFACRLNSPHLQRAHILADRLGGCTTAGNLHLLCFKCHERSEMLDGGIYWAWLDKRRRRPCASLERDLAKNIKNLFLDLGIDFFKEINETVDRSKTVGECLASLMFAFGCAQINLPISQSDLSASITEKDRKKVHETMESVRQLVRREDLPDGWSSICEGSES